VNITQVVKTAKLISSGADMGISMVRNDGQSVPVGVGQPTLKIDGRWVKRRFKVFYRWH